MAIRILFIDEDAQVHAAFKEALEPEQHEIVTASSGEQALAILEENGAAIVICDIQLREMSGAEFLARSAEICPDAVRIALSGATDLKSTQAAVNFGRISHLIFKPWDDDILRLVVGNAIHQYQVFEEVGRVHEATRHECDTLQDWNDKLEELVREKTADLRAAYDETLDALVLALDSREKATAGHSRRVAAYTLFLAMQAGLEKGELENLYRGALLHDIGKIGVPDAVLLKPGKLNEIERRTIQRHVTIGGNILKRIGYLAPAIAIPRYHHERFDGLGYCEGISGDAIPLPARIFAVMDVYDALRSVRTYKKSATHSESLEVISAGSGTHFDPKIVDVFMSIPEEIWNDLSDASEHADHYENMLDACKRFQSQHPVNTRSPVGSM